MSMKHENLPPNCPMKKADYEHYCPSPAHGPTTYQEHGQCYKHEECSKIVVDFKKMNVPKTSQLKIVD
jgi:hypothetical protein